MMELSEDLRKFLSTCEEQFASRYTDDDNEFVEYCKSNQRGPPIEERWFGQQRRQGRNNDRDRRDDRNSGGGRDWNRSDRRESDHHGRQRDYRYREHNQSSPYSRPNHGRYSDRPRHYE